MDEYIKKGKIAEYKCETCKSNTQSTVTLSELKDTLIIQLMRFSFDGAATKLYNRVHFPRTLNMAKYIDGVAFTKDGDEDDESNLFDLAGVIMHSGIAGSGHYYCFLKNTTGESAEWLRFDDKTVVPWDIDANFERDCVGDGTEISPTPYVLIYRRHSKHYEELEAKRCRFDTESHIPSFSSPLEVSSTEGNIAESSMEVTEEAAKGSGGSGGSFTSSSTSPSLATGPAETLVPVCIVKRSPSSKMIEKKISKENEERDRLSSAFNMDYIKFVRRMYELVSPSKCAENTIFLQVPMYYMNIYSEIANSTEFNVSWLNIIENITKDNTCVNINTIP